MKSFILNPIGSIIDGLDVCFCPKENRQHVLFGFVRKPRDIKSNDTYS